MMPAFRPASSRSATLLAGCVFASLIPLHALAQADTTEPPRVTHAVMAGTASAATKTDPAGARKVSPFRPQKVTVKAGKYYSGAWGVDTLKVSSTASGNLIRFTYRVNNPELAKPLADRNATPYLFGQRSHAVLQVPVMDKVGPLRQAEGLKAGQRYWMAFSNKGNLVRPGDRVNLIIGLFHADGLIVE